MTVCIAAICDRAQAIVSVSDRMISLSPVTSADSVTVKAIRVHQNWAAMFAADNVTDVDPILRRVTTELQPLPGTYEQVLEIFHTAYQQYVKGKLESQFLGRYGLSLEEFRKTGLREFGKELFGQLIQRMDKAEQKIDAAFLVHGFDPNKRARIFTVESPGIIQEYRRIGFWAIGSGQDAALSILFFHGYNMLKSLEDAVYHCCEAKFMAEKASGVGRDTVLAIVKSDGTSGIYSGDGLLPIRRKWEQEGCPRLPADAKRIVSEVVEAGLGPMEPFVI